MIDPLALIHRYYQPGSDIERVLRLHSEDVTGLALELLDAHPEMELDRTFVAEAAMLHDIGIFKCNAPGIYCFGSEPYLIHGRIGAELLRAEGYPKHARVCERHTGAGITKEEIIRLNLPLPHQDFLPETMEEKVICYADKFFSKTHPEVEKTIEQAERSLKRFGEEGLERFKGWEKLFE